MHIGVPIYTVRTKKQTWNNGGFPVIAPRFSWQEASLSHSIIQSTSNGTWQDLDEITVCPYALYSDNFKTTNIKSSNTLGMPDLYDTCLNCLFWFMKTGSLWSTKNSQYRRQLALLHRILLSLWLQSALTCLWDCYIITLIIYICQCHISDCITILP